MSDNALPLRDYQVEGVQAFLQNPQRRQLLAWVMSAGKCLGAIACMRAIGVERVTVIAPAMARPVWVAEFRKWAGIEAHSILHTAHTKSLTAAQVAQRDTAYAAPVRIVSFNLACDIDFAECDMLIIDEAHRLGSPKVKWTQDIKRKIRARKGLPVLLLTGTPAPTETQQLWSLYDLLQPGLLGLPRDTGDIPWAFLRKYCLARAVEISDGETRTAFYGSQNEEELRKRTAHLTHRVVEAQLAKFLPPLRTKLIELDTVKPYGTIFKDWTETLGESDTHIAVLAYHHKRAEELRVAAEKAKWPVVYVTGALNSEARAVLLSEAAAMPRCCLVATMESVSEAVDLSFCRRALILEFHTSPGRSAQLLKRFGRSSTTLSTTVEYVVMGDDVGRMATLYSRLESLAKVMTQDTASESLQTLFKAKELTGERLDSLFLSMFTDARPSMLLKETQDE